MKKLIFTILIMFSLCQQAKAASMVDDIEVICATILSETVVKFGYYNYEVFPIDSHLEAFERCLNLYQKFGGDLETLKEKYKKASQTTPNPTTFKSTYEKL